MMDVSDDRSPILLGLEEFREHLGGELTIMLLEKIGHGIEVHEIDPELLKRASHLLRAKV
jgi:3-dehydroquinate synthase